MTATVGYSKSRRIRFLVVVKLPWMGINTELDGNAIETRGFAAVETASGSLGAVPARDAAL